MQHPILGVFHLLNENPFLRFKYFIDYMFLAYMLIISTFLHYASSIDEILI